MTEIGHGEHVVDALVGAGVLERTYPPTREAWLLAAVAHMRPWFMQAGHPLPAVVRVSLGWPTNSRKALAECWAAEASSDGAREVFVSPGLHTDFERVDTLTHELCHAALPYWRAAPEGSTAAHGTKIGHGKPFQRLCLAIGLEAPWKSASAGPELTERLNAMLVVLGPSPSGSLARLDMPKQSTRLLKCVCSVCGYNVRVTAKWLGAAGAPLCPNEATLDGSEHAHVPHGRMTVDGAGDSE